MKYGILAKISLTIAILSLLIFLISNLYKPQRASNLNEVNNNFVYEFTSALTTNNALPPITSTSGVNSTSSTSTSIPSIDLPLLETSSPLPNENSYYAPKVGEVYQNNDVIVQWSPSKKRSKLTRREKKEIAIAQRVTDSVTLYLQTTYNKIQAEIKNNNDSLINTIQVIASNQEKNKEALSTLIEENGKEQERLLQTNQKIVQQKIAAQNNLLQQIKNETSAVKKIEDKLNKITESLTKLEKSKELPIVTDLDEVIGLENYRYFYKTELFNENKNSDLYKITDRIEFNIDFTYYLEKVDFLKSNSSTSSNQTTQSIKTKKPIKYAVVQLFTNIGKVEKRKVKITTDTIALNMLNMDYQRHELTVNYTLDLENVTLFQKTKATVEATISYFDYNDEKYYITENKSLTLYIFPQSNTEYLYLRLDESLKLSIDKLGYLITSIIGLIVTAILNFAKRKLNLPVDNDIANE